MGGTGWLVASAGANVVVVRPFGWQSWGSARDELFSSQNKKRVIFSLGTSHYSISGSHFWVSIFSVFSFGAKHLTLFSNLVKYFSYFTLE